MAADQLARVVSELLGPEERARRAEAEAAGAELEVEELEYELVRLHRQADSHHRLIARLRAAMERARQLAFRAYSAGGMGPAAAAVVNNELVIALHFGDPAADGDSAADLDPAADPDPRRARAAEMEHLAQIWARD